MIGLVCDFLVPTRRRGNAVPTRQRRGPQARKDGTLARPKSVPTPARGNQKRRRVGTRKSQIGSHAGAWEPENVY